ncbi:MAG: dihydrofolate synthase / folylpolyglutamate synthase [Candidatus Binatota bacterium]|nr:dihydrofolate synthase / folylpolyglutamate synthase [Candidatus Binatota bacterium]
MDVGIGAYEATLRWLYEIEVARGWDLKLESVRRALAVLGDPHTRYPSLHVAGTNGKGSTAAIAHSVLGRIGVKAGLYTSPHLSDFTERIRIGDQPIGRDDVVRLAAHVRAAVEPAGVELTFFELATVLAFVAFAEARVDAAVVEVGLGGRLDATNVIVPRASIVTTIAHDHESWLGDTVAAIAAEKGGIIKPGVPLVVGRVDEEAAAVLAGIAAERRSPLRRLGRDFEGRPAGDGFDYRGRRAIRGLRLGLRGAFQIDNAAVALAGLEEGGWLDAAGDEPIRDGVVEVCWPGRLEVVRREPLVIVDGAHNPAAAAAVAREIPAIAGGRDVHLVFGVLRDKRWESMAEALAPVIADAIVVPVAERRSADPTDVARAFAARVPTRTSHSAEAALTELLEAPSARSGAVLVTGSLFLVGEVREWLARR